MVGVLVGDEAGETVGFGEDLAYGVSVLEEGLAGLEGPGDFLFEEVLVDFFLVEGQDFDGEAGGVVVGADAEELVLVVEEGDELAVFDADGVFDFAILNPGVVVADFFVATWFEACGTDRFHGV